MRLACMAVQQPFADLLVRGVKDVENRGSAMPSTLRGQWCAIYASKTLAPVGSWIDAFHSYMSRTNETWWPWSTDHRVGRRQCTRGAIVGLVRWEKSERKSRSPWANPGAHHWTYSDRVLLANPIHLLSGGRQSLVWYLDEQITAFVLATRPTNGELYAPERATVADFLSAV